ncbi:MAG: hypothetical protein CSA58_07245 [Micrococcales bacterium]|nr:MAG: hypothetical protein CSA58_07245 [Micrococcales bacterium]
MVVMVVVGVLVAVGVVAMAATSDPRATPLLPLPVALLVITAMYMLAEAVMLNFETGRHGVGVTISDLPLVLGVFLLPPPLLLAACVAGTLATRSIRTTPPIKTLFNLSVVTAEIGVAGLLFQVLPTQIDNPSDASWWWTPFVIVLLTDLIGLLATMIAMRHLDSDMSGQESVEVVLTLVISGAFSAALAIICLQVLAISRTGIMLLVVVTVVLTLIYRSYAAMLRRHANLGQLMASTQELSQAHTRGDLAEALVAEAKLLVRASKVALQRGEHPDLDDVLGERESALLERQTAEKRDRQWLAANQYADAIILRVGPPRSRIGYLVMTDRLGDSGSFTDEDLQRATTLARHAEALWANSLLAQRIEHDATHDSLTGLVNRQRLIYTLTHRLKTTVVAGDQAVTDTCDAAVLVLDLTRFGLINESLGYPAGDQLLMVVSERLRMLSPASAQVARLGGDEFAVLLPGCPNDEVTRFAERIRETLREPVNLGGTRVEVACAVGTSLIPHDGSDAETLMRRADVAMYASKRTGRITRYHQSLDTASVDRLEILGDMRRSLDEGAIRPWFQPKIDLRTGNVIGFEALARWEHPTRGMVYPDEFIALAEQGGLSQPLTSAMLTAALAECSRWAPDLSVAVNVPARQLEDTDFAALVSRALAEAGVRSNRLTLEITEGSAVPGHLEALRSLNDLREVGVRISVDDFGTGYSALGYLHRLPVDEVKIDKSFVMPMRTQREAAAIVSTIIDLSGQLQLQTVAEGVEERAVADQLVRMGCTMAQGFMVSRPMPAHQVRPWLDGYAQRLLEPPPRIPHQLRPGSSQE